MLGKLNVLLMVIRESGLLVATGSCWTSMMIFLSSLVHSLISQCLCEQTNLPRAFLVHVRSLSSSNAILLKPGSSEKRALPASSSRASCVFHSVSLIILYHRISFSLVTIAAGAASLEML